MTGGNVTGAVGGCVSKVSHLEPVYRVPHLFKSNQINLILIFLFVKKVHVLFGHFEIRTLSFDKTVKIQSFKIFIVDSVVSLENESI